TARKSSRCTYYVNPDVTRISLIDCHSQRFNLADRKAMGLPPKDGSWMSLGSRIEFRVNPGKAAEVYVPYNEESHGDAIDEQIVQKIIMPSARSFCRLEGTNNLGRDFVRGETRTRFQEQFQEAMTAACEPLGIGIIQALITSTKPPQQIADVIRFRNGTEAAGWTTSRRGVRWQRPSVRATHPLRETGVRLSADHGQSGRQPDHEGL
ncbi:MAG TPA: hypothetical protein EYP14_07000, partial [Planctomycetaceae bacterium]|nr:hypothetical protein [Planctomycetaceae bacterium]